MSKSYVIPFLIFFTAMLSNQLNAQNKKEVIKIQQEKIDSFYRATDSITKVFETEKTRLMTLNAALESELKTQQAMVQTLTTQKAAQEGAIQYLEKKENESTQKIIALNTAVDTLKNELASTKILLDEKTQELISNEKEIEAYKQQLISQTNSGAVANKSQPSTANDTKDTETDDITGVYQWYIDGRPVLSGDIGESKYPDFYVFSVFAKNGLLYIAFANSINDITLSNLPKLVSKKLAYKGKYNVNGEAVELDYGSQGSVKMKYDVKYKSLLNFNPSVTTKMVFKKGI
ncbi:MAG: hypothetical protein ACKO5C_05025 [Ferruginibacter sp.]